MKSETGPESVLGIPFRGIDAYDKILKYIPREKNGKKILTMVLFGRWDINEVF